MAWRCLLPIRNIKILRNSNARLLLIPYIQAATIILFILTSTQLFDLDTNKIGMQGVVNSLLEIILFSLISVCFSRTKNKSLIYLEVGFLLLIAFNLAHRFSYCMGEYFQVFDIIWLLCLIVISFGLIYSVINSQEKIIFFNKNSIHVFASGIFIMFSSLIIIFFIGIEFILTSIQINNVSYMNILKQNMPSVLIFTYTLSILLGKLIAKYFLDSIESISKKIDRVNAGKMCATIESDQKFNIYELKKLDRFILKIIIDLQEQIV